MNKLYSILFKKKLLITLILFGGSLLNAHSQNVTAQRIAANEKAIPEIVIKTFKLQYPNVLLQGWFVTHLTYWQNDYSSDWYNGWYGQRTVIIYKYEKPNYYEVEFINNPGEYSRAIYNIYGHWYETRSKIKSLPMGIHKALENSKYREWKLSPVKEKIESPMWPVDIYRFQVSKGLRSEILRMDDEGTIIQVKELTD